MCKDSPDNSGINAAAKANAELGKEALDWYKQMYAEQAPLREQAATSANQVSQQQLASMQQNDSISRDYWSYQKNTFRPLEAGIVTGAQTYDTEARRDKAAGLAVADVEQQIGNEVAQQQRAMARMGVNPNSGRMLAMGTQMGMAQAAAKAGAASKARDNIEIQGYARKMDAANMGRNLASSQATSAGVALSAGNSAANTGSMALTQAQTAGNNMAQGFNTAMSANNSSGQLYGQAAKIDADANSGMLGDLATIGMSAAKLYPSDKTKKKNVKPVSDEQALEAVKSTPVSRWDYKPGTGDGGTHIGPMAQDANRTMGEQAAPGGKQVDLVTMNGMNMAATAALARKVEKLASMVEGAKA